MPSVIASVAPRVLLQQGASRLQRAGCGNAERESAWLLSALTGTAPLALYLQDAPLPAHTAARFFAQVDARASGTPLQYLLGDAEFFGLRFTVGPGVFIPRPETEAVVEAALGALRRLPGGAGTPLRILDLGTGSGCIALTLAHHLPACLVLGVELSWESLRAAAANGARLGLTDRVRWVQGDWLQGIRGPVDAIVSNPPYLPAAQMDRLPPDVRREPRMSLEGGADGLRDLRTIVTGAFRVLRPGGILALECGEEQVGPLLALARSAPWVETATALNDLAGRPRGMLVNRIRSTVRHTDGA